MKLWGPWLLSFRMCVKIMQKPCSPQNSWRRLHEGSPRQGPQCHWWGDGTTLSTSHRKSFSSAVHPGPEGASHWKEGSASEAILTLHLLIVRAMVLVVYDGLCYIYQCPGNVNQLWQYNIFWMYNFPIEIPCSLHWLSLVTRAFWKITDKSSHRDSSCCWSVGGLDASTSAITLWSHHLARVCFFDSFLPGHLSCRVTDLCRAQDLVTLPKLCSIVKLGTQQLPVYNNKHTFL